MADYTSPKPVDPIWYQPNAFLRIRCGCGRRATYKLRDFARVRRLPRDLLLRHMIKRLRCEMCGERPSSAEVTRYP
jgi:hypothetical protein